MPLASVWLSFNFIRIVNNNGRTPTGLYLQWTRRKLDIGDDLMFAELPGLSRWWFKIQKHKSIVASQLGLQYCLMLYRLGRNFAIQHYHLVTFLTDMGKLIYIGKTWTIKFRFSITIFNPTCLAQPGGCLCNNLFLYDVATKCIIISVNARHKRHIMMSWF